VWNLRGHDTYFPNAAIRYFQMRASALEPIPCVPPMPPRYADRIADGAFPNGLRSGKQAFLQHKRPTAQFPPHSNGWSTKE
jgi:hypothetical protein